MHAPFQHHERAQLGLGIDRPRSEAPIKTNTSLLRVERCKPAESGFKRGKDGKSWRIVQAK